MLTEISPEMFKQDFKRQQTNRKQSHLAAGQLSEVRLQLLSDYRVDGHQAEDAGLPHAALCVVVALQQQMR